MATEFMHCGKWSRPVRGGHNGALRFKHDRRAYCDLDPVFRENFHDQYAKRHVCLVFSGMCEVSRFKIVVASFVDCLLASLSECEFTGDNISNSRPNVVMYSDLASGGKGQFGGPQFELAVKFGQVAEDNLLDFDRRRDASCLYGLLSRQAACSGKQRHEQQ
jgi:hypothetical protein